MRSANLLDLMSRTRRLPRWRLVVAATLVSASGFSQSQGDGDEPPPAPTPAGTTGPAAAPAAPAPSGATYGPNFVPAAGTNLEGYLPSSSQAKGDIYTPDGFDLKRPSNSVATVRGNADNLGVLNVDTAAGAGETKSFHIVRKGDTMWGITGEQLGDSRLWPRIWAQNPQLQNPHWIYPGDQLRLREGGSADGAAGVSSRVGAIQGGKLGDGTVGRAALVPPETVFLRELGYIDEPEQDTWGQVVGAREEQQLLSDSNRVYMILRPGAQVQLGQLMTVFEDVRDPPVVDGARRPPGKLVSFQGTIKIEAWDANTRVARGEVVESLDAIERGAKVGPVGRRYYVVPPASSQVQIQARVLTSLYPHLIMGRDQVVFIDRGANDGLKPGNRLFVIRKGDAWRRTLETASVMARSRIRMDVPERVQLEVTEREGDEETFPEEVVAELRVIRSHRYSSLALVTQSQEEIEPGDQAVTRKGY